MDEVKEKIPNPGSDEAIDLGCICPIVQNYFGKAPFGRFIINSQCPIHRRKYDKKPEEKKDEKPEAEKRAGDN